MQIETITPIKLFLLYTSSSANPKAINKASKDAWIYHALGSVVALPYAGWFIRNYEVISMLQRWSYISSETDSFHPFHDDVSLPYPWFSSRLNTCSIIAPGNGATNGCFCCCCPCSWQKWANCEATSTALGTVVPYKHQGLYLALSCMPSFIIRSL